VPNAKRRCDERKAEADKVKLVAKKVQEIEAELKAAKDRQDVLNDLYNQRICWAKLLDRLAEARAIVSATNPSKDDVVLIKADIRRSPGAMAGNRRVEVRQLYLQAFVATSRKEAGARELSDTALDFLRTLSRDSIFKQDFECDETPEKNAKYSYLGDTWSDTVRATSAGAKEDDKEAKGGKGAAAKDGKESVERRDELKATLTFEVLFTFKPPPTIPKAAPPPKPQAGAAAAAKK
jgi:hypothetical protein